MGPRNGDLLIKKKKKKKERKGPTVRALSLMYSVAVVHFFFLTLTCQRNVAQPVILMRTKASSRLSFRTVCSDIIEVYLPLDCTR